MDKMINTIIEGLYDKWVEEGKYTDLPSTLEATKNTYNFYWDKPEFENTRLDFENAISRATMEFEKQGFIYGFKKAMEMFAGGGNVI